MLFSTKMSNTIFITLPVYHSIGKKTIFLGINWYRNAHFFTSNKVKKEVQEIILSQLPLNISFTTYQVTYKYYYKSKVSDLPNVTALASKFLNDSLKEAAIVPDDNINFLKKETCIIGGYDKINPRIEVIIGEYNEPDNTSDNTTK